MNWALVESGQMHRNAFGFSRLACSVILEKVSRLILEYHGTKVSRERIEWVVQRGTTNMPFRGAKPDIKPSLDETSKRVGPLVVNEILDSLRREKIGAYVVLMVGGGAHYFLDKIFEELNGAVGFMPMNRRLPTCAVSTTAGQPVEKKTKKNSLSRTGQRRVT